MQVLPLRLGQRGPEQLPRPPLAAATGADAGTQFGEVVEACQVDEAGQFTVSFDTAEAKWLFTAHYFTCHNALDIFFWSTILNTKVDFFDSLDGAPEARIRKKPQQSTPRQLKP
ncbi:MAG: hypothetical protein LWW83_07235 [Azonexaceae bacterium]|nr:hypothetical protein [Azonexus sp. R2A61]MCE1239690.1 hypothetical protein [Azonexaceae bacterium]